MEIYDFIHEPEVGTGAGMTLKDIFAHRYIYADVNIRIAPIYLRLRALLKRGNRTEYLLGIQYGDDNRTNLINML